MYKSKEGLINAVLVNDLLTLCNEQFTNPLIQRYAGANYECMYCGAIQGRGGTVHHSAADCPVIKYADVAEKHRSLIDKI